MKKLKLLFFSLILFSNFSFAGIYTFTDNKYVEIDEFNMFRTWNLEDGNISCQEKIKTKLAEPAFYEETPEILYSFNKNLMVVMVYQFRNKNNIQLEVIDINNCKTLFYRKNLSNFGYGFTEKKLVYFNENKDIEIVDENFKVLKTINGQKYTNFIVLGLYKGNLIMKKMENKEKLWTFKIKIINLKTEKELTLYHGKSLTYPVIKISENKLIFNENNEVFILDLRNKRLGSFPVDPDFKIYDLFITNNKLILVSNNYGNIKITGIDLNSKKTLFKNFHIIKRSQKFDKKFVKNYLNFVKNFHLDRNFIHFVKNSYYFYKNTIFFKLKGINIKTGKIVSQKGIYYPLKEAKFYENRLLALENSRFYYDVKVCGDLIILDVPSGKEIKRFKSICNFGLYKNYLILDHFIVNLINFSKIEFKGELITFDKNKVLISAVHRKEFKIFDLDSKKYKKIPYEVFNVDGFPDKYIFMKSDKLFITEDYYLTEVYDLINLNLINTIKGNVILEDNLVVFDTGKILNPENNQLISIPENLIKNSFPMFVDREKVLYLTLNNELKFISLKNLQLMKTVKIPKLIEQNVPDFKINGINNLYLKFLLKNEPFIKVFKNYVIYKSKNKIKIFDVNLKKVIKILDNHIGNIKYIGLENKKLITNAEDEIINIWDLNTGKRIKHIEPYLEN